MFLYTFPPGASRGFFFSPPFGNSPDSLALSARSLVPFSNEKTIPSDELLTTAFGWGRSTYWRGSVEEATPDPAAVERSLSFLLAAAAPSDDTPSNPNDLSLSRDEALAVLRSFPETLNLDADEQLRANVAKLAKEWKIQGPAAKGCVKRTPRLLGYTIDCSGDCIVSQRMRERRERREGREREREREEKGEREREKRRERGRRGRREEDDRPKPTSSLKTLTLSSFSIHLSPTTPENDSLQRDSATAAGFGSERIAVARRTRERKTNSFLCKKLKRGK